MSGRRTKGSSASESVRLALRMYACDNGHWTLNSKVTKLGSPGTASEGVRVEDVTDTMEICDEASLDADASDEVPETSGSASDSLATIPFEVSICQGVTGGGGTGAQRGACPPPGGLGGTAPKPAPSGGSADTLPERSGKPGRRGLRGQGRLGARARQEPMGLTWLSSLDVGKALGQGKRLHRASGPPHPRLPDLQAPDHVLQLLATAVAHCGLRVEIRALEPGHHLLGKETLWVLKAQPIQQLLEFGPATGESPYSGPASTPLPPGGGGGGRQRGLTGRRLASRGSRT